MYNCAVTGEVQALSQQIGNPTEEIRFQSPFFKLQNALESKEPALVGFNAQYSPLSVSSIEVRSNHCCVAELNGGGIRAIRYGWFIVAAKPQIPPYVARVLQEYGHRAIGSDQSLNQGR